ncbi:response regulator [Candidatus Falkowbacteria bacterium]|nr:response regulator [Candidatus Falkowbacteria bacterium]
MSTQNNNSPKSILLIEDEAALQEAIKMKLEKDGIKVTAFFTAEDAREFLKTERPDLVWLDILLPGMNGLEFLKQIREDLNLKDLPVVVVSVSSSPEKIKKAFSLNIADFIVKSESDLKTIIARVEGHLSKISKS